MHEERSEAGAVEFALGQRCQGGLELREEIGRFAAVEYAFRFRMLGGAAKVRAQGADLGEGDAGFDPGNGVGFDGSGGLALHDDGGGVTDFVGARMAALAANGDHGGGAAGGAAGVGLLNVFGEFRDKLRGGGSIDGDDFIADYEGELGEGKPRSIDGIDEDFSVVNVRGERQAGGEG